MSDWLPTTGLASPSRGGPSTPVAMAPSHSHSVNPAPWQLHALCICLPLLLTWLVFDMTLLTAHVLGNSLAYALLLPEGILLATTNILSRRPVRSFSAHLATQMTALMLSLLGAGAMLLHQHAKRAPHFMSIHSWCGVATILAVEFGGLFGALAFSGVLQLPPDQLALMRFLHRGLGRLALLLSSVTMVLGLHVFDVHHPRHQGWKTYAAAGCIVVHAVGMHNILWHTMPLSWHALGPRLHGDALASRGHGPSPGTYMLKATSSTKY